MEIKNVFSSSGTVKLFIYFGESSICVWNSFHDLYFVNYPGIYLGSTILNFFRGLVVFGPETGSHIGLLV